LVTLSIQGQGIVQLTQPLLRDGDATLRGEQVATRENGKVVTYSFPATLFGDDLTISVGPFARRGEGKTQRISFDLGGLMARNGLGPSFADRVPVEAVDIIDGPANAITQVDFARTAPGKVDVLAVTATGNWDNVPDTKLILSDGSELTIGGNSSGYRQDPTGAITEGETRFWFEFADAQSLRGVATLVVAPSDEIVRGTWEIRLTVRP
jgi:hypothetical protein